jgi:putative ATP-dependent endonuclease of OLD family
MNLSQIEIRNFHSIEYLKLNLYDFSSLIGPNNCGKSTILRAIEIFLNQIKPDKEEWRRGFENENIEIIGTFDNIQDWERDMPGVSGLVNNGIIKLKYTVSQAEGNVTTNYECYVKETYITGFSDTWAEVSDQVKEVAQSLGFNNGASWRTKANRERVKEKIISDYPDLVSYGNEKWTSENISIAPALKQAIPQAVIVPAVKDASDETKTTNKTAFGILLNKIVLPAVQATDEYKELLKIVEKLTDKLTGKSEEKLKTIEELTNDLSNRLSSLIESKALITLTPPDTEKFLGSNTTIKIDDGTETSVNLQGNGLQRALIFSLIEVLAKNTSKVVGEGEFANVRNTILLFEEPELFLHPHLMRRLKNALKLIANNPNWQVVISTHSPFLIDVVDNPKSLIILKRCSPIAPPCCYQLEEDPFSHPDLDYEKTALRASIDFHPTVNEAFFAERVVLVEGDTEIAVFKHEDNLHTFLGIPNEKYENITIVSCGGKWTIPAIARLLSKFQIDFRVVHDIDRKGRTESQLQSIPAIDPYNANAKIKEACNGAPIYMIDDTFEDILWDRNEVDFSSKDKPFKAWKKIKQYISGIETIYNETVLKELASFIFN